MLNDDIMDDLENSVVDHDLIQAPSQITSSSKAVVLIGNPKDQTTTPLVTHQLTQANVQFQIIGQHSNKIIEMQAVHDEIAAEGVVSKIDVAYALEEFPHLLGTKMSLEQFTNSKTKVNYDMIISNMKRSIGLEEALLFENAKTFLKDPMDMAIASVAVLLSDHLPAVKNTGNDLHINAKDIASKLEGSKHTVVKYKEEFKSFLNIPIRELIPDMFIGGTMDQEAFKRAVANIEIVYECKALKTCIASVIYGEDLKNVFSSENMRGETIHDLSFKDLLNFFSNEKFPELFIGIEDTLKDLSTKLDFLKNSAKTETATPIELHKFLIENNSMFVRTMRTSVTIVNAVFSLGQLNFNTRILFEELKKA
jgi:hypothetical protein